jgi:antitoxin VapB
MQTAKLFPNGQSQAVRLPKEFRFEGDRVYIQRAGAAVVLLPYQRPWQVLFDSLADFSPDFAGQTGEANSGEQATGEQATGEQTTSQQGAG